MDKLEVEVFRAGDYGPRGAWPEAALDQLAADYDPALHEAPVTLDHAQSGPAQGWVCGLRRAGDRLVATLRGLSRHVRELLASGAYKKRSVELYPQFGETGRPYLRAVSLLGAAVPAVKGLADPLIFEEEVGEESQSAAAPTPNLPDRAADIPVAFAELATQLRGAGRWQPAWEARGIAQFFAALDADRAAWFAEFLRQLPPAVELASVAEPNPATGARDAAGTFEHAYQFIETAPGGPRVAPESLRLHQAAVALQRTQPALSYSEALLRAAR